jgi:hypothetical protein
VRAASAEEHLHRWLAERLGAGDLVDVDGVLVDLSALARRRFECRPLACTPGSRDRGIVSCCADIEVPLTGAEARAITRGLPAVASTMAARDRRWSRGIPVVFDASRHLLRPGRRCVFAYPSPSGLRCGLHTAAEEHGLPVESLKPSPCRLFPLVVLEYGGRTVLTASYGDVSAALGGPPEHRLACLGLRDAPPLFESCRRPIEGMFGGAFYRKVARRARGSAATATATSG